LIREGAWRCARFALHISGYFIRAAGEAAAVGGMINRHGCAELSAPIGEKNNDC
jgi:hypothetical protein